MLVCHCVVLLLVVAWAVVYNYVFGDPAESVVDCRVGGLVDPSPIADGSAASGVDWIDCNAAPSGG